MIVKCPFNKIKKICKAMIGLEKSFQMMYSNIGLNSYKKVHLKNQSQGFEYLKRFKLI